MVKYQILRAGYSTLRKEQVGEDLGVNISEAARRILQLNRITNISADYLNRLPIPFIVEFSDRSTLQSQLSRIPAYPDYLEEQLRLRKEPELKKLTATYLIESADPEALNKLAVGKRP